MKSSEYNYKVYFCDSIYYSAEDVVKIISKAVFDYQLCNMPEYRNIAIELAIVKESEGENDSIHKTQNADFNKEAWLTYQNTVKAIYEEEELRDQQYYFMDRMIKSVLNHEIEFWNVDATKVIDLSSTDLGLKTKVKFPEPVSVEYVLKKIEEHTASILDGSFVQAFKDKPKNQSIYSPLHRTARYQRQYDDIEYWISRSTIYKSDLIKFGKNQKIEVLFDDKDKETSIKPGIPGLIPRISVGKLAVRIAWDIEQQTGKFARPKEVMTILQQLADEGKHSEFLQKRHHKGVEWLTDKSEDRIYTLNGCGTALREWRKSRVNKQELT